MKKKIKYFFHIDHLFISALTLSIIGLIVYVALNLSFLDPVARAIKSFSMSDIYYEIMNMGDDAETSKTITLVDITELTHRDDIAKVINTIAEMEPSVLGVDIIFEGFKDDEAANRQLVEAFENIHNKSVFAKKLLNYNFETNLYDNSIHSFFIDNENPLQEGFTNVKINAANIIKQYDISINYKGDTVFSFPAQIAKMAGYKVLPQKTPCTINYKPIKFPIINKEELAYSQNYIKDHIVIIGATKEEGDMHLTPIGKKSGLEITAYTLLSLIDGYHISHSSLLLNILFALIAGYIANVIHYILTKLLHKKNNNLLLFITESALYVKIINFCLLVLVTWIAFLAYIKCHFHFDTVLALTTIVLIGEGRLLFKGIISVLYKKFKWSILKKSLYLKVITP